MHDESIPARNRRQPRTAPDKILLAMIVKAGLVFGSDGQVWRTRNGHGSPCEPRRAESHTPLGYLQVKVMVGGERWHVGAHRLVYRHFVGPIPDGTVINHLNGRKDDNRPANLECVSSSENTSHAHRTGLKDQRGQRNPAAKLTDHQVAEIRLAYAVGGVTMQELADRYGIRVQHVSRIVRGEVRASQLGPVSNLDHRHVATERDKITGRFVA